MAVIAPLVERAGQWLPDRSRAPLLVPVLSLGRCMAATEGSGAQAGSYSLAVADREAGGPQLRTTYLSPELFEAAAMEAVSKDLMEMKVAELKEELEARDELKTGNKAWLRRRLHGATVRVHLEATAAEDPAE